MRPQPTPRRSRRVRTVLVSVLLCLVGGAAVGYWHSRSVIRNIERHGGQVGGTVSLPRWMESWCGPATRRFLLTDRSVFEIQLGDLTRNTDPRLL